MTTDGRQRGLYNKYRVERYDGSRRHWNCDYFVLDVDHDPYALPALEAYISACVGNDPELAHDLRMLITRKAQPRIAEEE